MSKAVAKGMISFNKKNDQNQNRSPLVPPSGSSTQGTSRANVASMFENRGAYRGWGGRRGGKRGGRGRGGAPASQKAADQQPFQK